MQDREAAGPPRPPSSTRLYSGEPAMNTTMATRKAMAGIRKPTACGSGGGGGTSADVGGLCAAGQSREAKRWLPRVTGRGVAGRGMQQSDSRQLKAAGLAALRPPTQQPSWTRCEPSPCGSR